MNVTPESTASVERVTGSEIEIGYHDLLRTGPGTLAGRYLRSFWQPVSRSEDISPGCAKPLRIMSEDFTLYRGTSGNVHVVEQRCPHRGTQLSMGWVEGDDLRCVYHGWKYDGTGQCIEQPAENPAFCQRIKLKTYPAREYLGLVFAHLGEGAPPEFPRIPEFENDDYLLTVATDTWPVNYFAIIENGLDIAHTAFLHWQFKFKPPDQYAVEETPFGIKFTAMGLSGGSSQLQEQAMFNMPNAIEFVTVPAAGETVGFFGRGWRVPRDDDSAYRFQLAVYPVTGGEREAYIARTRKLMQEARANGGWSHETRPVAEFARAIFEGRETMQTLKDNEEKTVRYYMVNVQDCAAQMGLGRIAYREHNEHLGRTDMGVALLRRLWTRELKALAEGQPLTLWRRPDYLWGAQWQTIQWSAPPAKNV